MKIINADVYCADGVFRNRSVCTFQNFIAAESRDGIELDASGCLLIPGLTDIHFHGCAGYDFCDGTFASLERIAEYEASRGITSIVPATMTLPLPALSHLVENAALFQSGKAHARLAGIYLEGPFLSKEKCGAQDISALQLPNMETFKALYQESAGLIRFLAIAPELEDALPFIRDLNNDPAYPVVISLAHTAADYEIAKAAFAAGASQVTHLYNAMSGMSHRSPGTVGAAADSDNVMAELICDGVHVHPAVVRQTFKLFGDDRIILISDSAEATGMPDGRYTLGGQPILKKGSLAVLESSLPKDNALTEEAAAANETIPGAASAEGPEKSGRITGTIAGSVTDLMDCMRKAILEMGIPAESAVKCAAVNSAKAAGIYEKCGSIEIGKYADLVLLDKTDLSVRQVILDGKPIR